MHLFHLGKVDWLDSQLIYHAQPRVGIEGLNILAPRTSYVCIGYHQNLEQEVDLQYCRDHNIPVFRREVGGGAVFLDGNQIFYQLVLHKNNPLAHGDKLGFYQRMLEPVVKTYTELGVPAKFRPVNDIVTAEGRKISGNGAAEIGNYVILVGNLIADFDYETMTHVLRVPDEKFRDKVFKSLTENLTTLKRETGQVLSWNEMANPLIKNFEKVLGKLEESALPELVNEEIQNLKSQFLSDEWLFMKRKPKTENITKISSSVNVIQKIFKAPGGLIKSSFELKDNRINNLSLSGDYFCYPQDAISQMEIALEDAEVSQLAERIESFYKTVGLETPGIIPADWLKVLIG